MQWDDINVILEQAVGYLGELKASLAMLVEFFVYVRNIVSVGMNDACARFIAKVKAVSNRLIAWPVVFRDTVPENVYGRDPENVTSGEMCYR